MSRATRAEFIAAPTHGLQRDPSGQSVSGFDGTKVPFDDPSLSIGIKNGIVWTALLNMIAYCSSWSHRTRRCHRAMCDSVGRFDGTVNNHGAWLATASAAFSQAHLSERAKGNAGAVQNPGFL